ncbi:MAG TPA: hypothetical protein VHI13_01695 [Candidatus Kapabacteria bacterium]|nr:hypothetical protein [Candidatus Kapabacteria bacterium]
MEETTEANDLKISFQLTPQITIVTTVQGPTRSVTNETIVMCDVPVWSGTLTPVSPTEQLPIDIVFCNTTVEKNATLALIVPAPGRPGAVRFQGTVISPGTGATPYDVVVAVWEGNQG